MSGHLGNRGLQSGPVSPHSWKRAVRRRAPSNFYVEVLRPGKHGNRYGHGFRIYPIKVDDISSIARTTSSSESIFSSNEYEIWRKWEDCLLFQDTLELEYSRAARDKRNRLAAGKGVKKNGVYIHSDEAASWESLPFGPDPNDIAYNIHQYIPKLSKKGALFRASQELIDHRHEELQAMMQVLLQDDLPTLIKEIKATCTFTDFFAVWEGDVELARRVESPKKQPTPDRHRPSLSASISSAFPAPLSSFSIKSLSPSKGKAPENAQIPFRTSTHSDSSSSEDHVDSPRQGRLMDRAHTMRSRDSSSGSCSSSSSPSTPVTTPRQLPPTSRQPAIASQEVPIRFGHKPHVHGAERSSPILESLPEDRELSSSPKSDLNGAWTRRQSGSAARNRNIEVYVPAPASEAPSRSLSRYSTASLQSMRSSTTVRATAYLDELDVDYCLPSPTPEPRRYPRASVSSLASIVTNSSVDAVIPRSERSGPLVNNARRSLSLPEESWTEYEPGSEDDSHSDDQGDILDAYFHDLIIPHVQTPYGYPETPTVDGSVYHFSPKQSSTTVSSYSLYSERRSSLATSISSGSTSSCGNPTTLCIKAMHEDNIIMLRLPRNTAFGELRRKIYDKFIETERSSISESFAIALLEQPPERADGGRARASSLSSLAPPQTKGTALHFISSQDEWDDVLAIHGGKLLFRIIGSRE